jgi:putative methyltransferase (TIGR04325 family)
MGLFDFGERLARNAWRIPVIGGLLQRDYQRSFNQGRGRYRGVYSSFAEAERSIPPGQKVGFDHAELAGMYRNRMLKANMSDYGVLYWLRRILQPSSFVFDFGGHVGVSYHGWRSYLDYPPGMRWLVYDLPAITRVGEELAREQPSPGLAFTNDVRDARGCDIFLVAGSLQFVEKSLTALLDECSCRPRHLLLNKMPLYDGEPFVTVQSAGSAFHPYQISNRQQLIAEVTGLGYRMVDDWTNAEQFCHIPFNPDRDIDAYSGFYFVLDPPGGGDRASGGSR